MATINTAEQASRAFTGD